ncbi:MAG: S-layer homology domain-containing protein [Clostridia bacterium]|nr:S-layer homology domain-containing protein [Clostridia bacterium]
MLQKSKKLIALIACVVMCISMLSSFAVTVVAAEDSAVVDPYAVIEPTLIEGDVWLPGSKVLFTSPKFTAASGESFDYTYGDGENWGTGVTYRLTMGVNAFEQVHEAVTLIQDTWNAANTSVENYTGPDTVIVAPGTYGSHTFQNKASPTFDLPIDSATGKVIVDPAYFELFSYTILGPQAGKNPVTEDIDHARPVAQNGRSVDNTKEAVSTSTIWSPRNGQVVIDGFALRGDTNFYRNSLTAAYPYTSTVLKNIYHVLDSEYSNGLFRYSLSWMSANFEMHDYYLDYKHTPNWSGTNWNMSVDRFLEDNVYYDCTELLYNATQNNIGYMMRCYPQPAERIAEGWLGDGVTAAEYTYRNVVVNNSKQANWMRFYLDHSEYAEAPADSINITFDGCTFYNCGDTMRTTYGGVTASSLSDSASITDTISFQDDWAFDLTSGALNFNFINNTIQYTKAGLSDSYDHTTDSYTKAKTSGGALINFSEANSTDLNTTSCKHDFYFKNNKMILFKHNLSSPLVLFNRNIKYVDTSSMLVMDENGTVMNYATGGYDVKDHAFDSYAGDDFAGGIVEMFTLTDGKDMGMVSKVSSFTTTVPAEPTADVLIVPYLTEKSYPVEEIFTFRGNDVEFVALYDGTGVQLAKAKPSDLNGATMIATYKGSKTTCTVTYNIKIADADDMLFIDPTDSKTSYTFNGTAYTLNDDNRVATTVDAAKTSRQVWVFLPGEHRLSGYTSSGSTADRIDDYPTIMVGPKFGISPLNKDMSVNTADRGISGSGLNYTADASEEAVLKGGIVVYHYNTTLAVDGVISESFRISMDDAKPTHDWASGGGNVTTIMKNTFFNGLSNHAFDGISSGDAFLESKNKRSLYLSDTAVINKANGYSLISSGLYDIKLDRVYATGGIGALVITRMPDGRQMRLSPDYCGFEMTNCYIKDWGTEDKNFIYTNYVEYPTASWGNSGHCTGEYFPKGIQQTFDGNTFENVMSSGCEERGYALRLGVPSKMDNTSMVFTNNTVTENAKATKPFIYAVGTGSANAYTDAEVSGNVFVNFTEPVRLSQSDVDAAITSLDENYFATIVGGKEVVTAIVAKESENVSKSDWYYMNREQTVKDTDFKFNLEELSADYELTTLPDFAVDANLICGLDEFEPELFAGAEGVTVVGLYSDKACTNEITGTVTVDKFYVLAQIENVEVVFTVTTSVHAAHNWSEYFISLNETCTDDGTDTRECALCKLDENVVRPALGHVEEANPTIVHATCTENGGEYVFCVRCSEQISGIEYKETALGHDYDEEDWAIFFEGDCTHDAIYHRTCERGCGYVDEKAEPAPGHEWNDWEVVVAAECTLNGEQCRGCANCDAVETLPITALGHNHKASTTEPGCAVDGKVEYTCTKCGNIDETLTETLLATGIHNWGNFVTNEATCETDGVTQRFCKACYGIEDSTRAIIPASGEFHRYTEDWKVTVEGDCLHAKELERTCDLCGFVDTDEDNTCVTGAHDFKNVITPATINQTGKIEKICNVCVKTELVKLLPRSTAFTDVEDDAWYADYVNMAAVYGITTGYEDQTFRPGNFVTRAEAVVMISRVAGVKTSKYSTKEFADVPVKAWYNGAVAWAEQNKIVSGRDEDTFDPEGDITRQEMCTVLVRYVDYADIALKQDIEAITFADDASIAKFAKKSVARCQKAGLVSGRPGNNFAPHANATRAETAKILVTFMEDYVL